MNTRVLTLSASIKLAHTNELIIPVTKQAVDKPKLQQIDVLDNSENRLFLYFRYRAIDKTNNIETISNSKYTIATTSSNIDWAKNNPLINRMFSPSKKNSGTKRLINNIALLMPFKINILKFDTLFSLESSFPTISETLFFLLNM